MRPKNVMTSLELCGSPPWDLRLETSMGIMFLQPAANFEKCYSKFSKVWYKNGHDNTSTQKK
jgi:hypothetical protein